MVSSARLAGVLPLSGPERGDQGGTLPWGLVSWQGAVETKFRKVFKFLAILHEKCDIFLILG